MGGGEGYDSRGWGVISGGFEYLPPLGMIPNRVPGPDVPACAQNSENCKNSNNEGPEYPRSTRSECQDGFRCIHAVLLEAAGREAAEADRVLFFIGDRASGSGPGWLSEIPPATRLSTALSTT